MNSCEPVSELSRIIDLSHLQEGNNDISVEASSEECELLAKRYGIRGIDQIVAQLQLDMDKKKTKIHLSGDLQAEITQDCVITLEPVHSRIEVVFERNYADLTDIVEEQPEIDLDASLEEEPAEPFLDGKIDVGEAIAEQLALEIDPFPRSPNAKFTGFSSDSTANSLADDTEPLATSPFAVLARLKERQNTKS